MKTKGAVIAAAIALAAGGLGLLLGLNGARTTHAAVSGPCGSGAGSASVQHVVWIMMENHNFSDIVGNTSQAPYENQVASQCGLATNYQGITHPSLPNYIAATSGSAQGISDDNPPVDHPLNVPSIYTQLASAGKTWKDYEESAPGNCPSDSSGEYAVKHDPAPYYTNIAAACAANDVPLGTLSSGNLASDITAGTLPSFSFITPNLIDDMHDGTISQGDTWLQQWVPKILAGPNYQAGNTAVVITFDEDEGQGIVYTSVISPYTAPGGQSSTAFSHYSLLKTTEQLLGLNGFLGNASGANSMLTAFFSGAPTTTSTTSTTSSTSTTRTTSTTSTTTPSPQPKVVLPKRSLTPGAYNLQVRQSTIGRTICVPGYTSRIRPASSYTNALKRKQMPLYGLTGSPSLYEEDQLIPLELGGAPRNPKNLWPEPRNQARKSDPLETSLKRRVCRRTLTLLAARLAIRRFKFSHG